jgi:hypothetical protein
MPEESSDARVVPDANLMLWKGWSERRNFATKTKTRNQAVFCFVAAATVGSPHFDLP